MHDIAIHSYRIAKILLSILSIIENRLRAQGKRVGAIKRMVKEIECLYEIVQQSQAKLLKLRYFLSGKFLHQLHVSNIIVYDEKGNLIIKDKKKFSERFEKFVKE